jgi:hypothetical protein
VIKQYKKLSHNLFFCFFLTLTVWVFSSFYRIYFIISGLSCFHPPWFTGCLLLTLKHESCCWGFKLKSELFLACIKLLWLKRRCTLWNMTWVAWMDVILQLLNIPAFYHVIIFISMIRQKRQKKWCLFLFQLY